MLKTYIKEVTRVLKKGDAREESYYRVLAALIENYAQSTNKPKIEVTISPKKTEAGNPDFRVWDGKQHIIGYIEAKPPEEENLDKVEESEQLKRYLSAFSNVILTNFFEFRLYRNGELIDKVQIGRSLIARQLKLPPPVENENGLFELLNKFFTFSLPRTYTPKTLAEALACRTHYLREQVERELNSQNSKLAGFYEAFQQHLIAGLTKEDFADMYAQTVTYGLFAASTRSNGAFNRKMAFDNIPRTIGILRDVFRFVSLEEPGPTLLWIIDDIADVLAVANVKEVLHKYFVEGRGSDPIIHFYETFLAEYDPKEREQRGVYYTPEDVVSYIVRSLNIILQEYFNKSDGFATDSVTVLDPAAGTLTFLAEAAKTAVNEFSTRYGTGGKGELIKNHILKNFYAFELMMAPYAVGHLKMGFLLEEFGYALSEDDRLKLYLTNTLELEELAQSNLPGMSSLSQESHAANKVKNRTPILVILGNPPYSGHSANRSWKPTENGKRILTFIGGLLKDYYQVDGKPLGEKNPKWLQDDYVKFIRFAQWKIDKAGEGVLGFITNHSYLDNPTFRGMRQSLMDSFDHIYILDLHGNSKKKEKCPDGSKDENVFDIQQGVAIILAVKKKGLDKKISHADLWGLRENKYNWLSSHHIHCTKWEKLEPKSEFYFFIPRDEKLLGSYQKYVKITDIFPTNSVGVVTSRDKFVIDFDKAELKKRIRMFCDDNISDSVIKQAFGLTENQRWKLKDVRKKIQQEEDWEKQIIPVLYRPFDSQWIFYNDAVVERTRKEVMRHMMVVNVGLLCCRQQNKDGFFHALVSDKPVESCIVSDKTREIGYLFPLYIYPELNLFNGGGRYQREINISPKVLEALVKNYGRQLQAEQIFYYIYAVLYSNIYRQKYAEFLKSDFPRIPFCCDYKVFTALSKLGGELADLHLMKSKKLDKPIARFEGKGDNLITKVEYNQKENAVYINSGRYFGPISRDIWEYQIGGYQVMAKWLKDRKGRRLLLEDIKNYCKIATTIDETMRIQGKIDATYRDVEKSCINVQVM